MNEENGFEKIEAEADRLIELASLLKKGRSPSDQEEVLRIYHSSLAASEKADQIRMIDSESDKKVNIQDTESAEAEKALNTGKNPTQLARKKQRSSEARKERYFGTNLSPEGALPIKKNQIRKNFNLKYSYQRSGYLTFLFQHYRKMKEFGFSTKTMVPKIFPPGIKLDRDVETTLELYLKPVAKDISVILNQLMGNSWLYLKKKEYNLLVVLLELCNSIEATNFRALDFTDNNVIDKLKKTESLFLLIHYRNEYIEIIKESIHTLQKNNRRSIHRIEAFPEMIKKLLDKEGHRPSLFNLILALNMIKYRRVISFDELIIGGKKELIETREFDCSAETEAKIQEHIKKLSLQLEAIKKEKNEILKTRNYIHKEENGNVKLDPLITLYEQGDPKGKAVFSSDKNKLHSFLQGFVLSFLHVFENILSSKVKISNIGKVKLFEGDPFRKELSKLAMSVSKCEDLIFQLPSFTRERYFEISQKHVQAIQLEAEAVSLIDEVVSTLFSITNRLIPVLQSSSMEQTIASDSFQPIMLGVTEHKTSVVPLGNKLEEAESYFEGKSIGEALTTLISVSYLLGFYFYNRNIINILRRENQVNHDMNSIMETIERIAPQDVYLEIKEHFYTN